MHKLTPFVLAAAVFALGLTFPARPAYAAVPLTQAVVDAQVLPHVQALANNDAPPPGLTMTGDPVAPSFAALNPTGDAWGVGESVAVQNQGGTYLVGVTFGGLTYEYTVQASER